MPATINFGSCGDRSTKIDNENLSRAVKHTTTIFRNDMDWDSLGQALAGSPITDIYVGACSDGSEAISIKMLLEKILPKEQAQNINITAFDIGKENIAMAKCGVISLYKGPMTKHHDDNKCIDIVGEDIFRRNLEKIAGSDHIAGDITGHRGKSELYKMTAPLRNSIEFKVADALNISAQPFKKPIAFFFRNAWPYLTYEAQNQLAHNLSQNLPSNSLLGMGTYDGASTIFTRVLSKNFDVLNLCLLRKK